LGKGNKNVSHVKDYLKQAKKNEKSRHFEDAIENYTKAFYETFDFFLLYKRGCLYQKIGKMEKAAKDFRDFLSTDTRRGHGGTSFWSIMDGQREAISIANQQSNARITLSQVTFQKILKPSVPFDVYYRDKKLYNWGHVQISDTSEETLMLKKNPQEAAYRKGVKYFLQGKHEKAIQHLDEAITMNPEDARSYLFRSMVHALQSQHIVHALPRRKIRFSGPSSSTKELSWTKFETDLQRALALSKNNEVVERACLRTKYWLVDYERELARQYASQPTPAARLLGFLGFMAGILLGITFLGMGIASFFMSSLSGFSPIIPPIFLLCGVLSLFGGFSISRGKRRRGVFFIIVAVLIVLTFFFMVSEQL